MDILKAVQMFRPWNEQEARDREEILRRLASGEPLLTRENASAHLTASGWVVSPDRRRVLLAYHNLYDSWAWLGGHADGDPDLLAVALREVREESGAEARPVTPEIYSLEILTVDGHEKRGGYISSHLHLNATWRRTRTCPSAQNPTRTAGQPGSVWKKQSRRPQSHGFRRGSTASSTRNCRASRRRAEGWNIGSG